MATISRGFNNLGAIAASIQPYVEETLDHAIVTVWEVADPLTPVDTGALRANVTMPMMKTPGQREITWNQEYAAYQEFGTSRGVEAKKFASTGADAGLDVINERLAAWEGSL